jgi:hypothetical protein
VSKELKEASETGNRIVEELSKVRLTLEGLLRVAQVWELETSKKQQAEQRDRQHQELWDLVREYFEGRDLHYLAARTSEIEQLHPNLLDAIAAMKLAFKVRNQQKGRGHDRTETGGSHESQEETEGAQEGARTGP